MRSSTLLEIFLDQIGLLGQKGDVLGRGFEEIGENFNSLLEGFGEFALLLVTPGGFEAAQATVQAGDQRLHLVVEAVEVLRETPQFGRVYVCFAHGDTIYHMMRWKLAIVLLFGLVGLAADKSEQADWRSLFNGKDLDGWKPEGSAVWRVEDGVIVGGQDGDPKKSGLLCTKDSFKDFELTLDFMIDEHGKYNSGVYLRNDPNTAGRTGYQVNIGRGEAGEYCGGIYTSEWLAKGDEKDTIRKKLDWNTLHIIAQGPHLVVDLNGQRVADYSDPKPKEKWLQSGVVGLQTYGAEGHAGWVKFRNIKIREMK